MLKYIKHTKIQWWLTASLALTSVAMLATSCSNNDDTPAPIEQTTQRTYTANIPATIGNKSLTKSVAIKETKAIGTFQTSEKIYVYNATKNTMLQGFLQPSNISEDGKQCSLSGELTGTIDANDELTLLYNLTNPTYCAFDYGYQLGTVDKLCDGGIAKGITATFNKNVLSCDNPAEFELAQSVFRFLFADGDDNAINVKSVVIASDAISSYYLPLAEEGNQYSIYGSKVTITPDDATSEYLYVSLFINEEGNNKSPLYFTVTDAKNNVYQGTKDAPSEGFANGNFYYNSSTISLEKKFQLVEPDVDWTSVKNNEPVEPDEYWEYRVFGPEKSGNYQPSEITISGNSNSYSFYMYNGATVTLSNLTATIEGDKFIEADGGDLNLIVNGNNTITAANVNQAIFVDGSLTISGNGTLTVTGEWVARKGLMADNYNEENNSNPQVLAADGYTVTCEEIGTNTWKYSVTPMKN